MKLINLGCGTNKLPTPWENYDAELNIARPLPFEDGSVQFILIEHCLEHVNCADGFRFMREAFRCLAPGGVLRICVPELWRLPVAERVDICLNHGHQMIYCMETLALMLEAAGFDPEQIDQTEAKEIDGHWKVIGHEKDDRETLRVEATKLILI